MVQITYCGYLCQRAKTTEFIIQVFAIHGSGRSPVSRAEIERTETSNKAFRKVLTILRLIVMVAWMVVILMMVINHDT